MAKNGVKVPFCGTTLSAYKSGLKGSFWALSVPKISASGNTLAGEKGSG